MSTASIHPTSGPEFPTIGGRACLDLVATLGRRHAHPVERVPDEQALGRWFVATGLLSTLPRVSTAQLNTARELREAISRLVRAAMAGQEEQFGDVARVNHAAARPDLAPQISAIGVSRKLSWAAKKPSMPRSLPWPATPSCC